MQKSEISYRPLRNLILSEVIPWLVSTKVIVMGLFLLATGFLTVKNYTQGLQSAHSDMNFFESIAWFLMTGMGSISLCSLAFLAMIAEMPKRTAYCSYTLIRTSKAKWAASLIMQCFFTVAFTMLALLIVISVFLIPFVSAGNVWNDSLRIEAGMPEELAYIPNWIRASMTPIQAILLSAIPVFCFWFVMSLTILICSLLHIPAVGLALYSVILFSGLIFVFENFPGIVTPMTFSTLMRITANHQSNEYERLIVVFIGYAILIVCQITSVFLIVKRTDTTSTMISEG